MLGCVSGRQDIPCFITTFFCSISSLSLGKDDFVGGEQAKDLSQGTLENLLIVLNWLSQGMLEDLVILLGNVLPQETTEDLLGSEINFTSLSLLSM